MDRNTETKKIIKVVDLWSEDVYGIFHTREEAEKFAAEHLNNSGVYYVEGKDEG